MNKILEKLKEQAESSKYKVSIMRLLITISMDTLSPEERGKLADSVNAIQEANGLGDITVEDRQALVSAIVAELTEQ